MGKAKKAHRKRVQARNQRIQAERKALDKLVSDWSEVVKGNSTPPLPTPPNFLELNGSDADRY